MKQQAEQPDDNGFPPFPPPPPQEIISHRSEYISLLRACKYRVPAGISADTPLYTLYRLYEYLVVDHVIGYRNQLKYF